MEILLMISQCLAKYSLTIAVHEWEICLNWCILDPCCIAVDVTSVVQRGVDLLWQLQFHTHLLTILKCLEPLPEMVYSIMLSEILSLLFDYAPLLTGQEVH